MSTYTVTTVTVEPSADGSAYTWDVFRARKTIATVEVNNVDQLRAAIAVAAVDHYDADPATTTGTYTSAQPAKGSRHVAGGKQVRGMYARRDVLAARSATRAAIAADLTGQPATVHNTDASPEQ